MKIGLHVGTRGAALNSVTLLTIVNKAEPYFPIWGSAIIS